MKKLEGLIIGCFVLGLITGAADSENFTAFVISKIVALGFLGATLILLKKYFKGNCE